MSGDRVKRAIVLGGGVAGLVAAFGLADRGIAVRLLEPRKQVGGRAFSASGRDGRSFDNGYHAMLGCYRAMRALLRRLGTEHLLHEDRSLRMAYRFPGGRSTELDLWRIPVPLAMPVALLRVDLPWGARLRALWGMATTLFGFDEHASVQDWLDRRRQHGMPDDLLWRPLCRAVMNVDAHEASASGFLATLREAFFGRASSAAFVLPRADWGKLIGDAAPSALAAAGVALRCGLRVTRLAADHGSVRGIELQTGERIEVGERDVVVSAMPWHELSRLLDLDATQGFEKLDSSPIVTAYFELPEGARAPDDVGHVEALVSGKPFHFLLRRPGEAPHRFALLSGGDRSLDGLAVARIVDIAKGQLIAFHPEVQVQHADVVVRKEQRATFVAAPDSDKLRPAPGPLVNFANNLLVCGDWTSTGLPATLEGAARSAEAMLAGLEI